MRKVKNEDDEGCKTSYAVEVLRRERIWRDIHGRLLLKTIADGDLRCGSQKAGHGEK